MFISFPALLNCNCGFPRFNGFRGTFFTQIVCFYDLSMHLIKLIALIMTFSCHNNPFAIDEQLMDQLVTNSLGRLTLVDVVSARA